MAGAGLSTTRVPAAYAFSMAQATVSIGISSCTSRYSAPAMRSATASIASHVRLWLAPGATAMQFSPSCETKISAVPVGVSLAVKRASVLMPSAANCCRRAAAPASSPRHETKATSPPRRAAATAWLAPLPPLDCRKRASPTVSPGRGRCLTQAIMSMLVLPITRILFMFGYRWLISVVFSPCGVRMRLNPAEMRFFGFQVVRRLSPMPFLAVLRPLFS